MDKKIFAICSFFCLSQTMSVMLLSLCSLKILTNQKRTKQRQKKWRECTIYSKEPIENKIVSLCTSYLYPWAPLPHLQGKWWNSQAMMQCKYFLIVPAVPEKCGGYNIETLTPVRFSIG